MAEIKENFTSADNPSDTADVKKSLHSNREENREINREKHREKVVENSNIRKGTPKKFDVDNSGDNDPPMMLPMRGQVESAITDYINDFAREFNDQASLGSSVARAMNLYQRAGADLQGFVDILLQARAATKQRATRIRKDADVASPWGGSKNRMAYFFSVVEDKLNLSAKEVKG